MILTADVDDRCRDQHHILVYYDVDDRHQFLRIWHQNDFDVSNITIRSPTLHAGVFSNSIKIQKNVIDIIFCRRNLEIVTDYKSLT